MSDTKEGDEAKPKAPRGKTLSLKRTIDGGQVRQSFSHGRSKSVQVETRRRRIVKPGAADAPGGKPEAAEAATSAPVKADSAAPAVRPPTHPICLLPSRKNAAPPSLAPKCARSRKPSRLK